MESAPLPSPFPTLTPPPAAAAAPPPAGATSPCAGCKFLRRKCQPECVFAPYFPPDQPEKFAHVHRVFGASNVAKLLNELRPCQREDAVNSLAYEAEMRLRDPVYGCVGVISLLQRQLRQLQLDLSVARSELSKYHRRSGGGSGDGSAVAAGWADHHRVMMMVNGALVPPGSAGGDERQGVGSYADGIGFRTVFG